MTLARVLSTPLDTSALTEPIDRARLIAYRAGLPRPLNRSRAWAVVGLAGSVASFVFLIGFWVWVIGAEGFARAQLSEWLLYGTGAAIYSVIPALILFHAVRDWPGAGGRRQFRLDRFAHANGMTYRPVRHNAQPGLPGMIFDAAWHPHDVDVLTRYDATGLTVGNARFTTGTGKGRTVHQWGYASVQLGTRLPHIVLDARGNNSLVGRTNLPRDLDPRQRLSLEGDFDRHFALYCPREYERDALYLFTPDVMARFVDHAAEFDVEIVDDRLFLYAQRPLATLDPDTWEWIRATLAVLTEKVEQWRRWRDDRLGETRITRRRGATRVQRPPRGVAGRGRRLTERTPWWARSSCWCCSPASCGSSGCRASSRTYWASSAEPAVLGYGQPMAQVSTPSRVRSRFRVSMAAIAMGLALTGCSTQTPSAIAPTPDPAAVQLVQDYLDAIASGDAEAAHALDAHLFTDASYAGRDVDTLLTDEVLASSDRIQDVVVREQERPANPDAKVGIGYEYSLDGAPFSGTLHVRRDDKTSDWMLTQPLIGVLLVQAEAADGSKKPIDFSVPGADYAADPAADKPQLVSAYPAVYSVTAGVPEADLAPDAELTQRAVLGEVDGVYVNFAVTALP